MEEIVAADSEVRVRDRNNSCNKRRSLGQSWRVSACRARNGNCWTPGGSALRNETRGRPSDVSKEQAFKLGRGRPSRYDYGDNFRLSV